MGAVARLRKAKATRPKAARPKVALMMMLLQIHSATSITPTTTPLAYERVRRNPAKPPNPATLAAAMKAVPPRVVVVGAVTRLRKAQAARPKVAPMMQIHSATMTALVYERVRRNPAKPPKPPKPANLAAAMTAAHHLP